MCNGPSIFINRVMIKRFQRTILKMWTMGKRGVIDRKQVSKLVFDYVPKLEKLVVSKNCSEYCKQHYARCHKELKIKLRSQVCSQGA